ncbi:MarR family winged helix-turn-helix transcriptional regulator [Amycolatopsis saalfeldensis]|uniref:DNA-binding transcriptional regulator, MarR family n=1 Tax=Amycolatopsis saalfeldensis TaxID=394193 RepID=A0A1H8UZ71_9PSEU|nr:MarR family transcriptional regulator [Amycolatopsis saalfeldensis]SEP08283.1 DNA-binding transcriptional regulator, MarR family [Amycolatopsis saalfeldensis]
MVTRAERNATDPDLGVLAGRLLFAVQRELFTELAARGFDDLNHRHGAVLAYLDPDGVRATDLARLSGQHKQIIGTLIDELEALGYVRRRPDPRDRRAKLVCPTARGLAQSEAADAIMATIQQRHARRLGRTEYDRFKQLFTDITEHQRRHTGT